MKLLRIFTNREALLLLLIGLQAGASLAFPPPAIPAARPRTPTAAALALRMAQPRPPNRFVRSSGFGAALSVDFVKKAPARPKSLVRHYFDDAPDEAITTGGDDGRASAPPIAGLRLRALHSVADLAQLLDALEDRPSRGPPPRPTASTCTLL